MCQLSLGLKKLFLSAAVACLCVTAAGAAAKQVTVGPGVIFTDVSTGTSNPAVTTINVGDTVVWNWAAGSINHSTTSGTCSGGCAADGMWDSPTQSSGSFSHTFNSPGTFHYFCRPHQAAMQGMVVVNVPPPPPDFTISVANPNGGTAAGPIFPSQQTIFNGALSPMNGYNNTVNLSCIPGATGVPSQCTPTPASVTPSSPGFTITAGAATPGHYDFLAQGSDGTITHTAQPGDLTFDVVDFGIGAPASPVTVFSPASGTLTSTSTSVSLTGAGAFNGSVTLTCSSGLPMGATCGFSPAGPYMPTAGSPVPVSVTITVPAATTAQDYTVTLSAASSINTLGAVTKTQSLTLRVVQFTAGAFSPASVTIGAGNVSDSAATQLTASTNFINPGTVAFACTAGLPPGGACNFSPGTVSNFPSSASVTVSVPFNTNAGSPVLTVTATGNSGGASASQTQPLTLNVPQPNFALGTASPATVNMVNNSFSQPVTVLISPVNFSGTVTPGCGNLPPAGVTCLFSPATSVNVNGSSASFAVVFEANGATPANLNNITINGTATINGTPTTRSTPLTQLSITNPASSTTITSSLAAVNSATSTTLINVGDPNLTVTATVNNIGSSTYSTAVWEVSFSGPIFLVAASNPNCAQVLSTVVTCNIGDVLAGNVNHPSFRVAPLLGRSLVAQSLVTSPTVGSTNLAGNQAMAPAVQVRHRPLARRGLIPKTP